MYPNMDRKTSDREKLSLLIMSKKELKYTSPNINKKLRRNRLQLCRTYSKSITNYGRQLSIVTNADIIIIKYETNCLELLIQSKVYNKNHEVRL